MNCEKFMALDDNAKSVYIGRLVHCCQSNDELFEIGKNIINAGIIMGLFEGVKIGIEELGKDTHKDG